MRKSLLALALAAVVGIPMAFAQTTPPATSSQTQPVKKHAKKHKKHNKKNASTPTEKK